MIYLYTDVLLEQHYFYCDGTIYCKIYKGNGIIWQNYMAGEYDKVNGVQLYMGMTVTHQVIEKPNNENIIEEYLGSMDRENVLEKYILLKIIEKLS